MTRLYNKVIHDCDPGPDDALALILSMSSNSWSVEGITTVAGNIKVSQCSENARKITHLCQKHIPVYTGAQNPLIRENHTLEEVFGNTGLPGIEDIDINPAVSKQNIGALDFLRKKLEEENSSKYAVCATGPLTNLARLILNYPETASKIQSLFIMGGCYFPEPIRGEMGNFLAEGANVKVEFNFAIDPEAANIVLNSDISNITVIGLNLTRKVLYNSSWSQKFKKIGNNVAVASAKILDSVSESHKRDLGHLRQTKDDPVRAIHDAMNVVYMERPELFVTGQYHVKVATDNCTNTAGYCSVSQDPQKGFTQRPITILLDGDSDGIFKHICTCLERYNHLKGMSHERG